MKKTIIASIATLLSVSTSFAQSEKLWTLQECVDYAVENNISIKQSELDVNNAKQDVIAAKWAFAPNLNASASQNFNFGSSISASGLRARADFSSQNMGVNSSVTLFNGFSNINTLKQSQIGVEAQDAALSKMKNDISLNVVNGYLQILFAVEQVRVAESQMEISKNQVERMQTLYDAGAAPEGDLLNIQSTLANDEQNLVSAQNTLAVASLQLAQMLQLPEPTINVQEINVNAINQQILGTQSGDIYNTAVSSFPEIKSAELNIESADKGIKIARANYYPTLTLGYGLNTIYQHRQGFEDVISYSDQLDQNLGHSVSFSLNIPLFNRFQVRTSVARTKINKQRSEYALESEKLRLRETINTAYTDAMASSKSFQASNASVVAQEKAFGYAEERFKSGAINAFDFNQSKNNLLNAQSQQIRSKYDFVFKLKVLEFYSGQPITVE